jgi:cytochrome c oxidase subunit 1
MVGHKLVGVLYGYAGYIGAAYGFGLSLLIRLELLCTGSGVVRGVKECWMYNGWISAHGIVMLFLFVMPMAIGGYGN